MRSATLYRYLLPMDSGVILRDIRLTHREGLVVALTQGDKTSLGEIAPLAGFSDETLEQAITQTQILLQDWTQGKEANLDVLYPSVAFGFSVALYQLVDDLPLAANYQVAPLCSGDPDEIVAKLALMQGQKIAKIKVGFYEPIRDGLVVNMLLEAIPELYLRLDANRQWSLAKAIKFADYIAPTLRSRICFIEEPCQSIQQSLSFSEQTGIAIAWDESSRSADFHLAAQQGLSAIVIKPTLVGSIEKVMQLVKKARNLGLQPVISSSLESSLGLNHLARLAHWLTPNVIPGLDTIDLFAAQLETPWPESTLPLQPLEQCEVLWQSQ